MQAIQISMQAIQISMRAIQISMRAIQGKSMARLNLTIIYYLQRPPHTAICLIHVKSAV